MGALASIIKFLFGSKADKDRKEIMPYVEKIKAVYPSIEALSNDELRERSSALRKRIADFIAEDEAHITAQKAKLEDFNISLTDINTGLSSLITKLFGDRLISHLVNL